jgi:UDP-N-acetylglucosamine--N-acetylmuramyl-(pentapeptide) pyrophosphoryl-undecaprenol N-acetylglucosamine transferase
MTIPFRSWRGIAQAGAFAKGAAASLTRAAAKFRETAPDGVVGAGGYLSAPVLSAALLRQIPIFLLEQNAVPGKVNRLFGRAARRIYAAWPGCERSFPTQVLRVMGNPIREALLPHEGEDRERSALLVLGGSQGAEAINRLMMEALPLLRAVLPAGARILHATGERECDRVRQEYRKIGVEAEVVPFQADMASWYRRSALAISRAGGMALSELLAWGIPSVLIPYPHAADDHQKANAECARDGGASVVCPEGRMDGRRLARRVGELVSDGERLERMRRAALRLARPDAADRIVSDMLSVL